MISVALSLLADHPPFFDCVRVFLKPVFLRRMTQRSYVTAAYYEFVVRQWALAASNYYSCTGGSDEKRDNWMKSLYRVQGGGGGWKVGLKNHRTLVQDTYVHVQCETRSQQ